jgi:hypothetical protein
MNKKAMCSKDQLASGTNVSSCAVEECAVEER